MSKGKYLLLGAGIVGLAAGGTYLYNLSRLSSELEIVIKAVIYKVTLSGLVVRVMVTLKNPTGGSLKVKYPFVKMLYKGNTFASSEVKDLDYELVKFGEKQLDPIDIKLSFITLASNVPALLKEYRASGSAVIDVETVTTLNDRIGYNKTQKIILGGKPAQ
ncbi:MAG TPA: hypothetical protein VNW99_07895 [Cytophagaceae bacterium]|jgi:hypothetical protein|nr:hypothetical protein [Cytophagaceae bacterium]